MENLPCPACGSKKTEIIKKERTRQAPFGPKLTEKQKLLSCNTCEYQFNYNKLINRPSKSLYEKSKEGSIINIFNYLNSLNIGLAHIERALELPQRTLSRWKKNKEVSTIAIALLRFLRAFPWLIKVAENKFDMELTDNIFMENAVKKINRKCRAIGLPVETPSPKILKIKIVRSPENPDWSQTEIEKKNHHESASAFPTPINNPGGANAIN